jgi:hypothetical protein
MSSYDDDDDVRWAHGMRKVEYSVRVHELHVKYYQRFSLLLSVLGIFGLSAPLSKAFGGDDNSIYIGATLFFIVIQAIDWQAKPGEKAGAHIAKASEFRRLARMAKTYSADKLDDEWQALCDSELTESEHVRRIAYVDAATEGGYLDELQQETKKLSCWQRILWTVLKF